jgi:hypothetical protein
MSDYALFFHHNGEGLSCKPDLTLYQARKLMAYWLGYSVLHPDWPQHDWVKLEIVHQNTM